MRAGFRVHHRGHGFTLLKRETRLVLVPSVSMLSPDMLDAILRSAGLTSGELETHLPPTPSRSGMFAKTPVDGVAPAPPSSSRSLGRRGR